MNRVSVNNKSSRIQSNLLQQNCFVRDVTTKSALVPEPGQDVFFSLDEKSTSSGVEFELNSYPYPITPQYVNSFLDSTDYRRDPYNAVASAPKRVNLGDVSSLQSVASMDMESARSLYSQLKAKFDSSSKVDPGSEVSSSVDPGSKTN